MSVTEPFQASVNFRMPQGTEGANASVNVPAGKRLVIEYVSGISFPPAGQNALFSIFTGIKGQTTNTEHVLPTNKQFGNAFVTGEDLRLYADPGSSVMLRLDRDSPTGECTGRLSFSGQLIAVS